MISVRAWIPCNTMCTPVGMNLFLLYFLCLRVCVCMCVCVCVCVYVLIYLIIPPTPWRPHTLSRDRQPWQHTVFILHTSLVELTLFEQQILLLYPSNIYGFRTPSFIHWWWMQMRSIFYVTALLYNVWRECYSAPSSTSRELLKWVHS